MGMTCKEFNDYEKACIFRDKVNGEIHWGSRKNKKYWTVWYTNSSKVVADEMSIEHAKKLLSVIVASISDDDDCFTIEDENVQVFRSALSTVLEVVEDGNGKVDL